MQIFITRVKDGRQLTLEVESAWSISELKDLIADHELGCTADLQRLAVKTSAEVELLGPLTLAHYGIGKEEELTLSEHAPCDGPPAPEQGATEQELRKLEAMRENLERRWVQLAASGRKLDEQKQVCAQLNGLPGGKKLKKKLKLNVGGRIFKDVLRETLCYVEESHLAELFSGRWEGKLLRDSSGKIFLDVNPDCFGKIVSFLAERQANPTAPIVAPTVPEELVPTLHRLLDFFGLGQLFAPEEEGVPPDQAGGEPEPEPDTEGDEAQAAVEDEQELIVTENEQVELPARTIDHVTQCHYGVLDQEMKRIDVTDLVADAVDDDGGLSMRVTSSGLGDPAPGETKQLSIRYQLASWETESFEDALVRLRAVAEKECAALRREIKKHRLRVRRFEREEKWVSWFLKAEGRQPAPEVVELDVGIGAASDRVCVKRSTLRQCEDSVLACQFDAEVWAQEHAGASSDSDDSDDSDAGVGKIAQDPLIFRKLVDQLRLIAIARADDPPPGPVLRSHEKEDFAKLLDYYFKGVEGFVKTDGEHRLAGTTVGKRIGAGTGTAVRFFLWGAAGGGNGPGNKMSGATGGFSCGTVQVPRGATVTLLAGRGGHKGGQNAIPPQPAAEASQGGNGPGTYGGGGGGGSFVVVDAELYLAAGGGGGSSVNNESKGFGGPGGGERGGGSCAQGGAGEYAAQGGSQEGPGQPYKGQGAAGDAQCFRMDRDGKAAGGSGGLGCAGGHGGAGGGGGYFGGAGGNEHLTTHAGGGGGSSFLHPDVVDGTMERGSHASHNGTAIPPHADHEHYKAPAGQCEHSNEGKHGRVVAVDVESGQVLGVAEVGGLAAKVTFVC